MGFLERACNQCFIGGGGVEVGDGEVGGEVGALSQRESHENVADQ